MWTEWVFHFVFKTDSFVTGGFQMICFLTAQLEFPFSYNFLGGSNSLTSPLTSAIDVSDHTDDIFSAHIWSCQYVMSLYDDWSLLYINYSQLFSTYLNLSKISLNWFKLFIARDLRNFSHPPSQIFLNHMMSILTISKFCTVAQISPHFIFLNSKI